MLNVIFETKRIEVELAKQKIPLADIRARANDCLPVRQFRKSLFDFYNLRSEVGKGEVNGSDLALIAEVKKASPSQGLIREDFDPVKISKIYESSGAQCLSILTDQKYFQGDPSFISGVRKEVELPILRKDFINDPYQIYEARVWGADAILLIVAALTKSQILDLMEIAADLSLDVLVEVHNSDEAKIAIEVGAQLIGVNNRDLNDFSTNLAVSEILIPEIRGAPSVEDLVIVSESALESAEDLDRIAKAGACSALIGTAFCKEVDIAQKMRKVLRR